jgi:shikimate dehydrogenase
MINSSTKIMCLLGHPVKQSFSPIMHNYLFKKYNKNNIYVCFDILDLKNTVSGIRCMNIGGINITVPYKVEIMKELDYIDENAKLIGAVNTIKNEGGILRGYNTDGFGFVKSIKDKGYILENKNVMILGAGGSCRSICVELAKNNVNLIQIRNRSLNNAKEIEKIINDNFDTKVSCSKDKITNEDLRNIDILINTTPIGMQSCECPINKDLILKDNTLVCDIVYKPHETEFLKWAKKQNLDVIYGIDMLINQGLQAFSIWSDIKTTDEDFDEIKKLYENYIKGYDGCEK